MNNYLRRWSVPALLGASLLITAATSSFPAMANQQLNVIVNGESMNDHLKPELVEGQTRVAARPLAEALGARVEWDGSTNTVTIEKPAVAERELRIRLLEEALAPESPEEAATQYAEALKKRNGAWQFAIMAPALREQKLSEFEELNWVTGTSSPWVEQVEVDEGQQVDEQTWRFEVTIVYNTSTNNPFESKLIVTVNNIDDHWFISSIDEVDDR